MKTPSLPLSTRIRLAVLRGLAKLLLRAVMPTPAMRPAAAGPAPREWRTDSRTDGHTYEGEFRRVDPRHNGNW